MPKVKIGQQLTLKIKRLGINGEGIGYFQRLITFVPGALPGETVNARVEKATEKFAEASIVRIVKKSPDRVVPPCPVYDRCGGCQLQHLNYQSQLDFKKDLLKQALAKFKPAGWESWELRNTLGMDNPWHYRNKAQFQLRQQGDTIEAGLYEPNSHTLVPLKDCIVQQPVTTTVMNATVALLNKYRLPVYDERTNSGILRTVMVRMGIKTGEVQVVLITRTPKLPQKNALIREMIEQMPEVVSIMQNVQPKKTSLVMGDETLHLWGKESIEEEIQGVQFDLSPRAFFQLNPQQTEILYAEARKALDPQKEEVLIDAYCGVGTIGLSMAQQVKEIRGMDTLPQAIDDAHRNAARLGVTNAHYEVGTAESLLPKWFKEGVEPDSLIVDPPRTGLDHQLLQAIVKQPPRKMVYISCNVSTLARDLVKLTKVYDVHYLQSVDMFPQTARCEVVVKLTRK